MTLSSVQDASKAYTFSRHTPLIAGLGPSLPPQNDRKSTTSFIIFPRVLPRQIGTIPCCSECQRGTTCGPKVTEQAPSDCLWFLTGSAVRGTSQHRSIRPRQPRCLRVLMCYVHGRAVTELQQSRRRYFSPSEHADHTQYIRVRRIRKSCPTRVPHAHGHGPSHIAHVLCTTAMHGHENGIITHASS